MIRLYLVVFLVLILISWAAPWLGRFGLGRLPGDLHWRWRGREWHLPVTSTILAGMVAAGISKLF
ncbi:DUF2905 domain-containing protein [Xylophilus sp. GOD-11R]|uniref:DUF2905 domain-containing protein n=1 Tax=Xylophilus sp. GOD-11R TaxID=3089814 RepID=UPI00298C2D08|nr:DUF2905 domain-containing protein [Xylophilus sp. GOD-11R]WPB56472.1 DUF2905 domain-containing protein [Xylophilus sp. GOD-11R]